jgi:hypothetical protein
MRGIRKLTHRRVIRAFIAAIAIGSISVLVGACGSSNSAATADPASMVPASAPLYVQLDVPDATQVSQYRSIVTTFGGAKAWKKLSTEFNKLFTRDGIGGYGKGISPWIGTEAGLAITSVSAFESDGSAPQGVVFILPTNNLQAAEAFVKKVDKGSHFTDKAEGSTLLIGTRSTLSSYAAGSSTLSSASSFQSIQNSTSGDNVLVYLNVHTLGALAVNALQRETAEFSGGDLSGSSAELPQIENEIAKLPSDATLGLGFGTTAKTIRLDVVTHDLSGLAAGGASSSGGDVSDLPAGSILAAALNFSTNDSSVLMKAINSEFQGMLTAGLGVGGGLSGGSLSGGGLSSGTASLSTVETTLDSVLGALGPLKLSISGSSILSLKGGLTLDSPSAAAASKLVAKLHTLISSSSSAQVTGTAQDFSVALGPYTLAVSRAGTEVLALLGYTSASQLTSPGSALSGNSTFKSAESQLPSGAKIPLFFNFEALSPLLSAFDTPSVQKVSKVVSKLSYLAVGSASGDTRIVLGLK